MSEASAPIDKPRQQSMLGILLLALHPLFGVTAVMGMLISTKALKSVEGTLYHSHLKWQIITFWIGCIAYILSFSLWSTFGTTWPIVVTFVFVAYRILKNLMHWSNRTPLPSSINL